ncbi:eukaryotic translation initiation factor 4B3-like [Olea europaea subsp. europaea]|uniref:Eukaryotic translation initiation factor 4B3-like n=1 Tax=Olea europaea subsp. europaea TaxID=158383 RepID=A0A8S0SIY2_OLEEU|nr:eukaryotic translation initiation factor 4B3-like [Olea europaea subsp. europaea]
MESAWGKPGAWALDSEENEAELLHQHKQDSIDGHSIGSADAAADFPSLAAAAATKTKKKKKGQTLSLQEFASYSANKGPTPDGHLNLPTAPRRLSAEELDRNQLGGGFKSYGSSYDRPARVEQPRRQGSFGGDSNRDFAPSRADETDNWAAGKKSMVNDVFDGRRRGDRGGFFSDSQNRADESDNWGSKKTYVPSEPRRNEKRGGFGFESNNGGADSDSWARKREEGRRTGGAFDSLRDRSGGFESNSPDSDSWGRKREEGAGVSASRPRLNLQPRTLPVGEGKRSENGNVTNPKGNNPFGEARPREEVLKEKGQDLKEIEEKLESTNIKEVSAWSPSGLTASKGSFWNGNGRERLHEEDRAEKTRRKPEAVNSRPQSAEKTENGSAEAAEEM